MRSRIRIKLVFLGFLALAPLILAVGLIVQRIIGRLVLNNEVAQIQVQIDKLNPSSIKFGTLATQSVDEYIRNLEAKIKVLLLDQQIKIKFIENAAYFTEEERSQHVADLAKVTNEIQQHQLYVYQMLWASTDYAVLRKDSGLVTLYRNAAQFLAQTNYDRSKPRDTAATEPIYIRQGTMIGTQGCTGVCTGTHLHFVTKVDGKIINPCDLLPRRPLSNWGDLPNCGVDSGAKLQWPMIFTWIVTQRYGGISPVINTTHEALDLIDRESAPVLAAHDGWFYTVKRPCKGAVVCNGGAANIAVVCEQKGCAAGLSTEYWHLDWMIDTGGI